MLRALLLRKKINEKKKTLDAMKAKDFSAREAELKQGIEEITEETTEEERTALEEAITEFETEKAEHEKAVADLEGEIEELESELAEVEAEQETEPEEPHEERKVIKEMTTRAKIFKNMDMATRTAMFEREDVKGWIGEIRSAIKEKRAITNVGLTIPTVFVELLRENIIEYSKLLKYVDLRSISGNGRVVIQGTYAEAVWQECCAELNEMSIGYNDLELGCWSVGGYFEVCNANLEDSDIDLAGEILRAIAVGIGIALDKAILYGTGTRMPLGIVTRLAQTEAPSMPPTVRPWADLHTTNIKTIANTVTGVDMFKEIILDSANANGNYSRGVKVWVMNEGTYAKVIANAVEIDASGAIVSGVNGQMPVVGGDIVVLPFVPANTVIMGYFDLYVLAERAGARFASSEHVAFKADKTVFKGIARYDGAPAIAEAFVAIGLGTAPGTTVDFADPGLNS